VTVAGIRERLTQPSPMPEVRTAVAPQTAVAAQTAVAPRAAAAPQTAITPQTAVARQGPFTKRRYIFAAVALGVALAAILIGSRLLNHSPNAQPESSIVPVPRTVQKVPEPKAAEPEPAAGAARPNSRKRAAPEAGPALPLRSAAAAKAVPGGSVPKGVVDQVLPSVSEKSRETIRGRIKVGVRVQVDSSGSVAAVRLDSPGPSKYFADRSLQAAQRWKFVPAKVEGREVSSEWLLRFEFSKTGVRVFPARVSP
jgi:TonB family protein